MSGRSRGQSETSVLQQNLEEQLDRLVTQLKDLEECKDELDAEEYEETKQETLDQLAEFKSSLENMTEGNLSLVDDINRMQLVIQAAISNAFQTPEVIKMFAKKQPGQLRSRLNQIERDMKIKSLDERVGCEQKVEVLLALKKLGEDLSPEEEHFLQSNSTANMKEFQQVTDTLASGDKVMSVVGKTNVQRQSSS